MAAVGEADVQAEGRRVEGRAAEWACDDELARRKHGVEPDHLDPRDRAVGVSEQPSVDVRRRELRVAAQAPAGDLDRRRPEHVVEPVARVDAVGDDGSRPSERAQPSRVGNRIGIRGRGLVAQRRLNEQRAAQRPLPDERPQPLDGRVMAVGEPDLQPARCARRRPDEGSLGQRRGERLLRQHVLAGLERRSRQAMPSRQAAWR